MSIEESEPYEFMGNQVKKLTFYFYKKSAIALFLISQQEIVSSCVKNKLTPIITFEIATLLTIRMFQLCLEYEIILKIK